MASRKALPGSNIGRGVSHRLLLLLANIAAFQQTVQSEPESLLHPQAVRKAKNDAEYNLIDSPDENKSE